MDLKLPDIVPAAPVPSAAPEIERAGARINQAATAIGENILAADKAQVVTQMQEASLQATRGLADTLNLIQSTPYLKPERVEALFGGKVPDGIALDEEVATPTGPVKQRRSAIPMHEVAPHLFDQQAGIAVDNAAAAVKEPAWQNEFRRAAAKDVERARNEAMDWSRAQRLADAEIRSVNQFQQAVAARNWNLADAILNNADFTMSVKTRETLRAGFPEMRTKADVEDRLRSNSVEELDKLVTDIDSNSVGPASLTPEEQLRYTDMARTRKNEIITAEERARKRAYEQAFEAEGDKVQAAITQSVKTGQPTTDFYSVASLPIGLEVKDYNTLKNMLTAPVDRPSEPRAELELANVARVPGRLGQLSPQTIYSYLPRLSEPVWRSWLDRWSRDRADPGSVKPPTSEYEEGLISQAMNFTFDKKRLEKDPRNALTARALLTQNVIAYKAQHPDEPLTQVRVLEIAGRTYSRNPAIDNNVVGYGPDTQWEILTRKLTPEAVVGIVAGASARGSRFVTSNDLITYYGRAQDMRPEVERLWNNINHAEELTDYRLVDVYNKVTNPFERKRLEAAARERLDAKSLTKGRPVTDSEIIAQAIFEMAPPESAPYREQAEEKATLDAKRQQVAAEGKRLAPQRTIEEGGKEAAAIAGTKYAPKLAVGEITPKTPDWERGAINYGNRNFAAQESLLEHQIRQRVYAEDYAAQIAANGGREYGIMGQRYADDPVRVAMEKRIEAEVRAGREARQRTYEAQFKEQVDAYRRYWAANMIGSDGAPKLWAPAGFLDTFEKWLRARQEGKL